MQNLKIGYGGGDFNIKKNHLNTIERKVRMSQKAKEIIIKMAKWTSFGAGAAISLIGWLMVSIWYYLIKWTQPK